MKFTYRCAICKKEFENRIHNMSDEKIEGFRVSDEVSKNLKKDLFRSGKTKKEWLSEKIEKQNYLDKTRNKPDEKWTLVPNSELEHLHSGFPLHYHWGNFLAHNKKELIE